MSVVGIGKWLCYSFQEWEANDYRMVRFVDQTKHVNEQYAIDLIAEEAPIQSSKRVVSCDGGGGPLGHPKVYINLVSINEINK